MTTDAQLWRRAKVLYDKGEKAYANGDDFHTSLGQVLKELKEGKSQREFIALTQEHLGVKRSKAYQLIAIADGKTTVERLREGYAKADAKRRLPAKSVHGHGQIDANHPDLNEVQEGVATASLPAGDQVDDQTDQDDAAGLISLPPPVSTAKQNHLTGSGNDEWHTPPEVIEVARKVLGGIDLDPASNALAQRTVKAGKIYTKEDDGLTQPWNGKIWLNPPYSNLAGFSDKLLAEIAAGRVTAAIMLSHNYTDTKWFHRLAAVATAMCFTRDRIKFVVPETGEPQRGPQGQMILYFGSDVELFRSAFEADVGYVVVPAKAAKARPAAALADADGSKLYKLKMDNLALADEVDTLKLELTAVKAELAAVLASPVVEAPPLMPDALPTPKRLTKHERALAAARANPELSALNLSKLPELTSISLPTISKARDQFVKESGAPRAKRGAAVPPAAQETVPESQPAQVVVLKGELAVAPAQTVAESTPMAPADDTSSMLVTVAVPTEPAADAGNSKDVVATEADGHRVTHYDLAYRQALAHPKLSASDIAGKINMDPKIAALAQKNARRDQAARFTAEAVS